MKKEKIISLGTILSFALLPTLAICSQVCAANQEKAISLSPVAAYPALQNPPAAVTEVVAADASLTLISSDFSGTEGPATDANGDVYFSDVFGNTIYKWTYEDNAVTEYKSDLSYPNGMMFDNKGNLVICEMGSGNILLDDMNGNTSTLVNSFNGEGFANPNDVWVAPNGAIYLTVFEMESIPGMESSSSEGEEVGVYYISPYSQTVTKVIDDIASPNGLIGTPDGKKLYVGDNDESTIYSYTINPDGTLSDKQAFAESETDGMAMDEYGDVYVTDEDVKVYAPDGSLIETIEMPDGCSNVEFCGPERNILFITYHANVYTLQMAVKGAPTAIDLATQKFRQDEKRMR